MDWLFINLKKKEMISKRRIRHILGVIISIQVVAIFTGVILYACQKEFMTGYVYASLFMLLCWFVIGGISIVLWLFDD